MKKNITVKIFAFLALFWIVISIIWTWIMIFLWGNSTNTEKQDSLTQEDLQKMIDSWKIKITNSWSITSTWETEK